MTRFILSILLVGAFLVVGGQGAIADDAKPAVEAQAPAAADPCACPDCPDYPCCECRKAKPAPCPAKYNNRRFLENWRPCLCVPCCDKGDFWDRLKARPLTRNNKIWVDLGWQVRLRWESFSNIGFGAPADPHDAWMLFRTRAHADLHFGDFARVYVEGIYADQWENRELGPRPIDRNLGDLLNAFAEVKADGAMGKAGVWAGRRELQTGKQRLVSPLDWANTRRTFEGVGAWWSKNFHSVEAWVTNPVTIDHDDFDEANEDVLFWGVDCTNRTQTCMTWGAYAYGRDIDAVIDDTRYTVGARIDGKIPNTRFDYDAEAAYQFGERGTGDVSASMLSATFGWKPCARCGDPRIGLGFDYASGDDNPADADTGTFSQLFPLGHKYLGHTDLIGRQNVVAARLEGSYKLADKLTFNGWYHMFWRADTADAAYNAGGGILRAAGANTDAEVGSELDLMLVYALNRHWKFFVEWAHFFPGSFIKNTGASEDVDVWYLGVQGTF